MEPGRRGDGRRAQEKACSGVTYEARLATKVSETVVAAEVVCRALNKDELFRGQLGGCQRLSESESRGQHPQRRSYKASARLSVEIDSSFFLIPRIRAGGQTAAGRERRRLGLQGQVWSDATVVGGTKRARGCGQAANNLTAFLSFPLYCWVANRRP
jgi:hypothetical protein